MTIAGERRAEVLLREGTHDQSFEIQLTPAELAAHQLDISLSLQGRGRITQCNADDGVAAVVEIEPESGLRLALDGPVETALDRLLLTGGRLPVAWPDGKLQFARLQAIVFAARLAAKGHEPIFDGDGGGLKGEPLQSLAQAPSLRATDGPSPEFPIALAEDGLGGARRFYRSTAWRYDYRVDALPQRRLPASLDLSLALGPLPDGGAWTVSVVMNGELLLAERSGAGNFQKIIAIPAACQRADNHLEITASAVRPDDDVCSEGPEVIAELRGDSVLTGPGDAFGNMLSELAERLGRAGSVALTSDWRGDQDAGILHAERLGSSATQRPPAPQSIALLITLPTS